MAILKPLALQKTLHSANTGGVYATLLLNQSGCPIAQAVLDKETPTASIAAHLWKQISKSGDTIKGGEVENLVLEFENGKVIVGSICNYVLCLYAKHSVQSGLLSSKFQLLKEFLSEPLSAIS